MNAAAWFVGGLAVLLLALYAATLVLVAWGGYLARRDLREAEARALFAAVMDAHTRGTRR